MWRTVRSGLVWLAMIQVSLAGPLAAVAAAAESGVREARSPIKHVIVIVGENRSFDHLFATYKPRGDEAVDNLLAKHIIREDGSPGKNFPRSSQDMANATDSAVYQLSPKIKTPLTTLPAPLNGGPTNVCTSNGICTLADAQASENGLAPEYYQYMLTGGIHCTRRGCR